MSGWGPVSERFTTPDHHAHEGADPGVSHQHVDGEADHDHRTLSLAALESSALYTPDAWRASGHTCERETLDGSGRCPHFYHARGKP